MKNFLVCVGILGLVFLASAGCSSSNTPGNSAGYKTKEQGGTGKECSDQLFQDAAAIQQAAAATPNPTSDQLNQLKTQVQAFKAKYDGVVCTTTDQNGKTITLDISAKAGEWLDQINKAIQAGGGGGGNPPAHPFGLQSDQDSSS